MVTVRQGVGVGICPSDQLPAVFQSLLVPPTQRLCMATVAIVEKTVPHVLFTTALYILADVSAGVVSEIVVLATVVQVTPPSVEYSQRIGLLLLPERFNVPLVPLQIDTEARVASYCSGYNCDCSGSGCLSTRTTRVAYSISERTRSIWCTANCYHVTETIKPTPPGKPVTVAPVAVPPIV